MFCRIRVGVWSKNLYFCGDAFLMFYKNLKSESPTSSGKRAFTLIEMLIAVAILAMLSYGLYTLFSRTVKNVDVGDWKNKVQLKMRTGIKQLNADISAACYPSKITIGDTVVDKTAQWQLSYKDGSTDTKTFKGDLLSFFICTPGKDLPDEKFARKIVKTVLSADVIDGHARLYYQKSMVEGTTDNPNEDNKKTILLEDVTNFDAKVIKVEDPKAFDKENKIKYVLRIEMQAVHPRYPKTIVTENTEVPLMVGFGKI